MQKEEGEKRRRRHHRRRCQKRVTVIEADVLRLLQLDRPSLRYLRYRNADGLSQPKMPLMSAAESAAGETQKENNNRSQKKCKKKFFKLFRRHLLHSPTSEKREH